MQLCAKRLAAQAGLEPATNWLTVNHSTNWVTGQNVHIRKTPHQPRGSRITTTELWGSLFNYAVTKLYRCRHPNISPQGNHLHSTIFRLFDSPQTEINAFGYSQITMSEWLVPTLWSLCTHLIAVTSAVYVWTLSLWILSLSWIRMTSKLCRWLAGENQRIYSPLFYSVNFLNP